MNDNIDSNSLTTDPDKKELHSRNSGMNTSPSLLNEHTTNLLPDRRVQADDLPVVGLQNSSNSGETNPGQGGFVNNNNEDDNSSQLHHHNDYNQYEHDSTQSCGSDYQLMVEFDKLVPASAAAQVVASLGMEISTGGNDNLPPSVDEETLASGDSQAVTLPEHHDVKQPEVEEKSDIAVSEPVSANTSATESTPDAIAKETGPELTPEVPDVDSNASVPDNTTLINDINDKGDDNDRTSNSFNNKNINSNDNSTPAPENSEQSTSATTVAPSSTSTKSSPEVSGSVIPETDIADKNSLNASSSSSHIPLLSNAIDLFLTDRSSSSSNNDSVEYSLKLADTNDESTCATSKEETTDENPADENTIVNTNDANSSIAAKEDDNSSTKLNPEDLPSTAKSNTSTPVKDNANPEKPESISSNISSISAVINYSNSSTALSKSIASSVELGRSAPINYHKPASLSLNQTISSTAIFASPSLVVSGFNKNSNDATNHPLPDGHNSADTTIGIQEPINKPQHNTEPLSFFGTPRLSQQKNNVFGIAYNHKNITDSLDFDNNKSRHDTEELSQVFDHYHQFTQNETPVLADIAAAAMALAHRSTSTVNISMVPDELGVFDIKKLIIKSVYGQKVETDAEISKVLSGTSDNDVNKHYSNSVNNHDINDTTKHNDNTNTNQIHYFRIPFMSVAGGRKLWLTTEYQVLGQDHAGYMYVQCRKNEVYRFFWDLSGRMCDVWAPIPTRKWVQDEIALLKRVDAILATPASATSAGVSIAGMDLINNYVDRSDNESNYDMALNEEFSSLSSLSTSDASLYNIIDEYETKQSDADKSSDNEESFSASSSSSFATSAENGLAGGGLEGLMVNISTSESSEEGNYDNMMLVDRVKRSKRKRRDVDYTLSVPNGNIDTDSQGYKNRGNTEHDDNNEDEAQVFSEHYSEPNLSSDEWVNPLSLNAFGRLRTGYKSSESFDEDHDEDNSDAPPASKQFILRLLKTKRTHKLTPPPPPSNPRSQSLVPHISEAGSSYVLTTRSGRRRRLPSRFLTDVSGQESFSSPPPPLLPPLKKKKRNQAAKNSSKTPAKTSSSSHVKGSTEKTAMRETQDANLNQTRGLVIPKLRLIYGETTSTTAAAAATTTLANPKIKSGSNLLSSISSLNAITEKYKRNKEKKKNQKEEEEEEEVPTNPSSEAVNFGSYSPPSELSARTRRQQARRGVVQNDPVVVVDISSDEELEL